VKTFTLIISDTLNQQQQLSAKFARKLQLIKTRGGASRANKKLNVERADSLTD